MPISVPSNSCRARSCSIPPPTCVVRVPGECAYYSGTNLSGPGINTGDTLNTLVVKIINYVSGSTLASVIPITSADFESDGVTCSLPALVNRNFEIFLNDLNRFIYNEVGNQEWDYAFGGGFQILLPGFNANTSNYHLYLFPKT